MGPFVELGDANLINHLLEIPSVRGDIAIRAVRSAPFMPASSRV